jgi:hypothetical protein
MAGLIGYTVDDVAAMVPAREIVPMRHFNRNVFFVTESTFARFQEMTPESAYPWLTMSSYARLISREDRSMAARTR